MPPVPIRIKAVREDPEHPITDCYPSDVETLAQLAVSAALVNHPSNKEQPKMSLNPEYISAAKPEKRFVPGIGVTNSEGRLVEILTRLGLCSSELAVPLKQIAANGNGKVSDHLKVSVDDLDRALNAVHCTIDQRMGFKASLRQAGLLFVSR
jgi:hypothetical protein